MTWQTLKATALVLFGAYQIIATLLVAWWLLFTPEGAAWGDHVSTCVFIDPTEELIHD